MISRLIDTLDAAACNLHPALVSPQALSALAGLARTVPDIMRSCGFECRLQAQASAVDLGVSVVPQNGGRAALARPGTALDPAWKMIGAFAAQWADPRSRLHAWVPFIFLEFDADAPRHAAHVPSIFVSFDWPVESSVQRDGATASRTETTPGLLVAQDALHLLLGRPLPAMIGANVAACFMELPYDGRVVHVGAMLGRASDAVRLSISVPSSELLPYLARIGWTDGRAALDEILGAFLPEAPRIHFEIDVGTQVGQRVGVVLSFGKGAANATRWRKCLDELVTRHLCTSLKRDAVLAWPGASTVKFAGAGFPCQLRREISHIKVTCGPGSQLEAKAYLTVTPKPSLFR